MTILLERPYDHSVKISARETFKVLEMLASSDFGVLATATEFFQLPQPDLLVLHKTRSDSYIFSAGKIEFPSTS